MNLTFIGYTWGKYLLDIAKNFKNLNISFIYPHEIDEETITHERLLKLLEDADGIVIDLRGGGRAEELIYKSLKELYDIKKVIIVFLGSPRLLSLAKLGKFTLKGFLEKRNYPLENISEPLSITERIKKIQKIIEFTGKILPISVFKDAKNYVHALKYLTFPCEKNYLNFLKLIGHYLGLPYQDIRPPKEIPEYGIYHPDLGIFTNIKEYLNKISLFVKKDIEKLPKFGILFYGGIHFQQNINLIKELIKVFDNVICIPVYTNGIQNLDAIQKFFFFEEKPLVSGILSLLWFRLNGGPFGGKSEPTLKLLKKLKVPLFNPVVMYRREIKKWQESDYGLSPIEVIGAVIWPEMDGSIEPIPVAGLIELEEEKTKFKEVFPIIDRLEKIKYRVENWFSLQTKKNEEKRVALIIYNYPPGEENLGKAAYLDVFKSVEVLLEVLQKEGYRVELPENFNLVKILEQFAVFNSPKWVSLEKMYFKCFKMSLEDWSCYLKNFPLKVFDELINTWGEPPGRIMVYRNEILIPCIELGNVLIGIQPARPPLSLEDSKRIAHDKTKPPHHQYIAFYKWLEVVWKADVVIHVGTHGLAEFTKGKEIGLSKDCFPDLLIGNIPHLYFYHVLNTSEATIAKRRFYGTLISYNSPPYTTAGLYEELLNLEDYLNEYEEALQLDVGRAKVLEEKIKKLANKLNFYFETIDELHDQLYHLKRSIIPKGLHILGENYKEKELLEFVTLFSRYDRGEIKSLNRIIAESKGLKYEEVLKNSKLLAQIEEIAYRVIEAYFQDKSSLEKIIKSKEVQAEIEKTLNFAFTIGKSFINNQKEIENFILGLEGKFIEPSVGGDVIRN
ncbi:MAG: cobaltochelatase subunit CobN, partial [Elusimicrobiota bacterium]|nr:cobaltochelatase subunit CobN [Endomicrobiia bacterium]MDW8166360.1 cobaltochelatase subunit CobN [Elusimicrobiota bacterium]